VSPSMFSPHLNLMEVIMHSIIYVSAAAIAIITGGVIVQPLPSATTSTLSPERTTIDPAALQQGVDVKALPETTIDDLI
jgi:hypothetical protein